MTDEEIKQTLYPMAPLGRWICARCNDGCHRYCEKYACECACRDERKPRVHVKRDRDRLSAEERAMQADFPFDSATPVKLKAEALRNSVDETINPDSLSLRTGA